MKKSVACKNRTHRPVPSSFFQCSCAMPRLTKINIGYSAISGDALPAWVAKDAGIFEKNGLDVQLVFFSGGTTAVMALVSADTPIAQLAGPAVVNSVMAGSDATLIVGGVTSLNYYLLSRSEIKTPEQLKGGSVAISRFGSSSDFIARYALSKIGLNPGKDVTIVQIGSTTARVDAALTGTGASDGGPTAGKHHRAEARHEYLGRPSQARARLPTHLRGDHKEIYTRASGHRQALRQVAVGSRASHLHRQECRHQGSGSIYRPELSTATSWRRPGKTC